MNYPSDWEEMTLQEFTEINPNTTIPNKFNYVDLESVKDVSLVNLRREDKITAPSRARRYAQKGDIFFQTVRPYQKNNYNFKLDGDYVFSTGYAQLRVKANNDSNFLFYLIRHDNFVNEVLSNCTGTSYPAINPTVLSNIRIHVPPLAEQQAIADTLTAFDTHIANLAELIEKKKAIRDGALEDLVSGRTRLPGFDYKWEDSHIGKILKILHGKNQRQVEATNGHYPIMGTGGIIGRATDYLCDWECVLIGRKGTINQPYYMNTPFWTIDTLYYSKPAENQCVKFQYYLFRTISWYDYTESSGRPSLTRKAIEGIEIKLPRYEEQKAIADVLTAMDDEIKALEDERNKIIQIREGAMDDLLTGRVRLSV